MDRKRVVLLSGVIVTWMLAIAGPTAGSDESTPDLFPDFDLTNWNGEEVGLDSIGGRAAIIVFTYAKCEFGCPMVTFYLKGLDDELGKPKEIRFVHISVNPADDSADEILKHFKKFDIDPKKDPRWMFLNGPADRIEALLAESGIAVKRTSIKDGVLIEHTIRVQVVDRDNAVIASFPSYLWDAERMNNALRVALDAE